MKKRLAIFPLIAILILFPSFVHSEINKSLKVNKKPQNEGEIKNNEKKHRYTGKLSNIELGDKTKLNYGCIQGHAFLITEKVGLSGNVGVAVSAIQVYEEANGGSIPMKCDESDIEIIEKRSRGIMVR